MKKIFVTAALGLSLFLPGCTADAKVQKPDAASSANLSLPSFLPWIRS